jgi:hypothetical protein
MEVNFRDAIPRMEKVDGRVDCPFKKCCVISSRQSLDGP